MRPAEPTSFLDQHSPPTPTLVRESGGAAEGGEASVAQSSEHQDLSRWAAYLRDWRFLAGVAAILLVIALIVWWSFRKKAPETSDIEALQQEEAELKQTLAAVAARRAALEEEEYIRQHPEELSEQAGMNKAVDTYIEARAAAGLEKVRMVMDRRDALRNKLLTRYETEQRRTMDSLTASATGLMEDIKSLADVSDFNFGKGATEELPPFALTLAGLVAPLQLKFLAAANRALLFWHTLLVVFDALVLLQTHETTCIYRTPQHTMTITLMHELIWLAVHFALHLFMLGVRAWAEYVLNSTHKNLQKKEEKQAEHEGLAALLHADTMNPRALFIYDYLSNSRLYNLATWLLIADFALNCVGMVTLFARTSICNDDDWVDFAIGIYAGVFTVFFVLNLLVLVAWVTAKCLFQRKNASTLLRKVRQFDAAYMPHGVPFGTVVLRTFIFRDVSDRYFAEIQCLEDEVKVLEAEQAELEYQLQKLKSEKMSVALRKDRVEELRQSQQADEEEFTKVWLKGLDETFGPPPEGFEAVDLQQLFQEQRARAEQLAKEVAAKAKDAAKDMQDSDVMQKLEAGAERAVGSEAVQAAREAGARGVRQAQTALQELEESEAVQAAKEQAAGAAEAVRAKAEEAGRGRKKK